MEYFDNILCVTYKELLDIMPKGTLNSQLSREKLDVVSRGGGENNPALYAYSSLPEKYKKRWSSRCFLSVRLWQGHGVCVCR